MKHHNNQPPYSISPPPSSASPRPSHYTSSAAFASNPMQYLQQQQQQQQQMPHSSYSLAYANGSAAAYHPSALSPSNAYAYNSYPQQQHQQHNRVHLHSYDPHQQPMQAVPLFPNSLSPHAHPMHSNHAQQLNHAYGASPSPAEVAAAAISAAMKRDRQQAAAMSAAMKRDRQQAMNQMMATEHTALPLIPPPSSATPFTSPPTPANLSKFADLPLVYTSPTASTMSTHSASTSTSTASLSSPQNISSNASSPTSLLHDHNPPLTSLSIAERQAQKNNSPPSSKSPSPVSPSSPASGANSPSLSSIPNEHRSQLSQHSSSDNRACTMQDASVTADERKDDEETPTADMDSILEARHFTDVIFHMEMYAVHMFAHFDRICRDFRSIDPALQRLLVGWDTKMNEIRNDILVNQDFLRQATALRHAFQQDDTINYEFLERERLKEGTQTIDDEKMSKVRSTLRQIVRDWSHDGRRERDACYTPCLRELERLFPSKGADAVDRSNVRVLVPGSGLARLTWEVANRGFSSQGNEFSYFMLVTCFLILNNCQRPNQFTIYPYIGETRNLYRTADQLRKVSFPDIDVTSFANAEGRFSMVAGDFMDVYSEEGKDYRMREARERKRARSLPSHPYAATRHDIKAFPDTRIPVLPNKQNLPHHHHSASPSPTPSSSSTLASSSSSGTQPTETNASSSSSFPDTLRVDTFKSMEADDVQDSSQPLSAVSSTSSALPSLDHRSAPSSSSSTAIDPAHPQQHPPNRDSDEEEEDPTHHRDLQDEAHLSSSTQRESWDAVVTCYFLDCATNILEFVRTIAYLLKPGGYWINFGPLLYHYSDVASELSIDLSYEELKATFPAFGLKLIAEKSNRQSTYTCDERSMLRSTYYCVEFTCLKACPDTTRLDLNKRIGMSYVKARKTRRGKGHKKANTTNEMMVDQQHNATDFETANVSDVLRGSAITDAWVKADYDTLDQDLSFDNQMNDFLDENEIDDKTSDHFAEYGDDKKLQ